MAKKEKRRSRRFEEPKVPQGNCPFDKSGKEPDYKDIETISRFISDRAKVLGKDRTGVCAKHQRKLTLAIKRARHLGLLPFTPKI